MTDYFRAKLTSEYSVNSDYSDPDFKTRLDWHELTPDEYLFRRIGVGTTAYTLDLGNFNTITGLYIVNHSTTAANRLRVNYHLLEGSDTATDLNFDSSGNPDTITDNGTGTFLTDGALYGGYVIVENSENSGENDGAYLIQSGTEDQLILGLQSGLAATNTNDTSANLYFTWYNAAWVNENDGKLVVECDIAPQGDLILRAENAALEATVIVMGT